MLLRAALILLVGSQTSCALWHSLFPPNGEKELEWIELAVPAQDVLAAVMKGDFRFLGVYGERTEVPGLKDDHKPLIERYGMRYIPGTTGEPRSVRHKRLNQRAVNYAKRYNSLLLKYQENASRIPPEVLPGPPGSGSTE